MFEFIHFGFFDVLDIILVGGIIFYAFRILKGSQAMSIFLAILSLYALRILCASFNMKLMSGLLSAVLDVGLIALIVIFQPEIRRFLSSLGQTYRSRGRRLRLFSRFVGNADKTDNTETINEICKACEEMSRDKCGALIVIQKSVNLKYIEDTGDLIDGRISKRLLMNLFFKNSPLHDGAVILHGDKVVAARCTLPITEQDTPAQFGMRHKAAIGISEVTDAQVVVVSEETGGITVMQNGVTSHVENINDLKLLLQNG